MNRLFIFACLVIIPVFPEPCRLCYQHDYQTRLGHIAMQNSVNKKVQENNTWSCGSEHKAILVVIAQMLQTSAVATHDLSEFLGDLATVVNEINSIEANQQSSELAKMVKSLQRVIKKFRVPAAKRHQADYCQE